MIIIIIMVNLSLNHGLIITLISRISITCSVTAVISTLIKSFSLYSTEMNPLCNVATLITLVLPPNTPQPLNTSLVLNIMISLTITSLFKIMRKSLFIKLVSNIALMLPLWPNIPLSLITKIMLFISLEISMLSIVLLWLVTTMKLMQLSKIRF